MKTVGIVGINGMVGQTLLKQFEKTPTLFSNPAALSIELQTFGRNDKIPALDVAVLCTDNADSIQLVAQLKDRVKYIVDMSSQYRQDPRVPLVIPEINPHAITKDTRLIASPNCPFCRMICIKWIFYQSYYTLIIHNICVMTS